VPAPGDTKITPVHMELAPPREASQERPLSVATPPADLAPGFFLARLIPPSSILSDPGVIRIAAKELVAKIGKIDILVHLSS
jgi:hypothetical protein